ncbi:transglutaminase-like domain-containing protein [Fulvivirgaceae bacterium PWU4]|uniref:Transglutaminase-like domain-containing protein n=1 Tax=Chryseosolibacter histidini TaxID=2782349 RepID=A0AAP2GRN7_9BACT|nr:DUF3857 domain-containing protein [Chryseosolibacter histidini]MBT1699787.1 transglutaminase-like domain-containing protein [Chryseosolibacter histidini]
MARYFLLFVSFLFCAGVGAQDQGNGFPFGKFSYMDLNMTTYDKDSSAAAVILNEFGEAYMSEVGDYNLVFRYHTRIKILKKEGLKYADIEIPLRKQDQRMETLIAVKAVSYTMENGVLQQTDLDHKAVFTVNKSKNIDIKKFAIPNVREGSVIEFEYKLESPFIFNFRTWAFQSDIPKMYSEYWARIPGNYIYNMTLRGVQKLIKNESELVEDCFQPGGGQKADCALYKFAMKDIPAFVEEDFMTASSNFLSAINFELSEIRYFGGRVDKITKEWKDAELELRNHREFGVQLRRGEDIVDAQIKQLIIGERDPLMKARKIYDFIKDWYRWDETKSMFSELGIKKAFDQKTGNVADINLSLIAALRYAGLNVEPVILSTRENGVPVELHPVLSDFNYVVAKVNIGDKVFLADATDDFHPFGLLPERCLNGKGRVLGEDQSYWIELKPADRAKQVSMLSLKLGEDGMMRGTLQTTYMGYEAVRQRKKVHSFSNHKEYAASLSNQYNQLNILNLELINTDEFDKPLVQKLDIEIRAYENPGTDNFMFNPFILGKWEENPFKSNERLYPVDFATPMEYITMFNLEYPSQFEIVNRPEKTGLSLPNSGGRYIYDLQTTGNKLSLNNALTISKALFSSTEYHYLKELFARIIQVENGDLIFRRTSP